MKFLVGERRALAAAVLAFYGFLYLVFGLLAAPPELAPALTALAALYGVAFFGLVAGWFWGRWYASGLAMYGVVTGALGMFQLGAEPILIFLTVSHALVVAAIAGDGMAAGFEGRTEWRVRFHLDEPAVERLGKSITRAAMTLPYLLLWALAPRTGDEGLVAGLIPFALGAAGLWALIRLRTWGVLSLAAAGAALVTTSVAGAGSVSVAPLIAAAVLGAAVVPFVGPIARHLGGHAR
jgi:hypothetical protein